MLITNHLEEEKQDFNYIWVLVGVAVSIVLITISIVVCEKKIKMTCKGTGRTFFGFWLNCKTSLF